MPGGGFSRIPPSVNAHEPEPQDDGRFTLGSFSIDEYKPIKVIVIGAGFSGILAGIRCVSATWSRRHSRLSRVLTC